MIDLEHARSRDASDPLRDFRNRFIIADPDQCYLDGNSLGRLPAATADAVQRMTLDGWGGKMLDAVAAVASGQERLTEAEMEVKKLEKHRGRLHQEWAAEQRREDNRITDEIGTVRTSFANRRP